MCDSDQCAYILRTLGIFLLTVVIAGIITVWAISIGSWISVSEVWPSEDDLLYSCFVIGLIVLLAALLVITGLTGLGIGLYKLGCLVHQHCTKEEEYEYTLLD